MRRKSFTVHRNFNALHKQLNIKYVKFNCKKRKLNINYDSFIKRVETRIKDIIIFNQNCIFIFKKTCYM